jgi:hypothetical protein
MIVDQCLVILFGFFDSCILDNDHIRPQISENWAFRPTSRSFNALGLLSRRSRKIDPDGMISSRDRAERFLDSRTHFRKLRVDLISFSLINSRLLTWNIDNCANEFRLRVRVDNSRIWNPS